MRAARILAGVLVAAVSAYAYSFAWDLIFGNLAGQYVGPSWWPVVTWAAIAIVTMAIARGLSRRPVVLWGPYLAFALFALAGAAARGRGQAILDALVMLATTLLLARETRAEWRKTTPQAAVE